MADTTDYRTRAATPADAAAIAAIYNEGIADRIATFETAPRSAIQFAVTPVDSDFLETRTPSKEFTSRVFPENIARRALLKGLGFRGNRNPPASRQIGWP